MLSAFSPISEPLLFKPPVTETCVVLPFTTPALVKLPPWIVVVLVEASEAPALLTTFPPETVRCLRPGTGGF